MHWDTVYKNLDYLLIGAYPQGPLGELAMTVILAVGGIFGAFLAGPGLRPHASPNGGVCAGQP